MKSNLIKNAIKTLSIKDNTENLLQLLQVKFFDSVKNCAKLNNYGFYSNAPLNSLVVLLQSNGQEEALYGIEDDVNNRPRNLKDGEVMVYNTVTKNYIYLTSDNNIEIFSNNNINLNAKGTVNINSNVNISGTLKANVIEAGNGASGTFSNSTTATKGIVTSGS